MKDPNCPICQQENWSGTPEYVEEVKENHLREHCEKCPLCGQPIKEEK